MQTFMKFIDQKAREVDAEPEPPSGIFAKPGQEETVQQLKVALDQGDAPATSPLGQKFKRFLSKNPDKKKDCDDLNGSRAHQMKQQFRMEWAKSQLPENAIINKSRKDTIMEE